jgi:hypothetical protein
MYVWNDPAMPVSVSKCKDNPTQYEALGFKAAISPTEPSVQPHHLLASQPYDRVRDH